MGYRIASDTLQRDSGRFFKVTSLPYRPPIKIVLTTFWRAKQHGLSSYSIANRQPDGFDLPTLDFLLPLAEDGKWLMERSKRFKVAYDYTLKRNASKINKWLESLEDSVVLCCWCKDHPYRLTRCSRIVVANLIRRLRPDIEVELDSTNPAWRA